MWISKKKWRGIEKRISALEKKEQERIDMEQYRKEHGDEIIEKAKKLIGLGNG